MTPLLSLRTNHCPHYALYNNASTCSQYPSWAARTLEMVQIGCPETVNNYQPSRC